jgi:nucleotide-binding universal stress UspA family protein
MRLAKENGAELTFVSVLEALPHDTAKLFKLMAPEKLEELLTKQRLTELEGYAAGAKKSGVDLKVKVLVGKKFIEVIREILCNGHDLLVKVAQGQRGGKDMLFGSTDLHLMRECPSAVWIMKPTKSKKYARILAAVDPDPLDEERNKLNNTIMELATSLSTLEQSELHIVHAWVLYSEGLLKLLIGKIEKLVRDTRKTHRKWLNKLLDKYEMPHDRRRVHMVRGKAKEVIPALAKKKRVELIVMGTSARTGLPQFLIGNTAEDVLNQVDCSVLMVKPEGFVSPVTIEA